MHRLATWLLLISFALLGTGMTQALHHVQHAMEHHTAGQGEHSSPGHDDSNGNTNCPGCVQLHQPLHCSPLAPLALTFVATIDLSRRPLPRRVVSPAMIRVDCRGPPLPLVVLD